MARTGDATYAAEKAGYGGPPVIAGSKLMAKEGVRAQVMAEYDLAIVNELLPAAYQAALRIFQNPHSPAGAVMAGFKIVKDHVFRDDPDMLEKDPSEMTLDEIARKQQRLQEERETRAKDITPDAPSSMFD
jgi:hypothetical protein